MLNYIIRRLLLMVPTVLGITLLTFFVMYMSPGGVGGSLLNESGQMRPDERAAREKYLNERFGLKKPFIVQYGKWLNHVLPLGFKSRDEGWPQKGSYLVNVGVYDRKIQFGRFNEGLSFGMKSPDLGRSFTRERPVTDMIADALPVTIALNLITLPIIYSIALSSGILTAVKKGTPIDVSISIVLIALWSLPGMWVGVMMIGFLANRDFLPLFPTGGLSSPQAAAWAFFPSYDNVGWLLDRLWHLAAPIVVLTYGGFAFLSKLTRGQMLENLASDYVRTARAKGQAEQVILFRHVLRNSILPLITVSSSILPGLLGGSAIIENIFSINGMGKMMLEAINVRDREVVLSITLVVAIISTISLLIADLCYVLADPRVSYE